MKVFLKLTSAILLLSICLHCHGETCPEVDPETTKAIESTTSVTLTVTNTLSYPVRFIWIDFDGKEGWTQLLSVGERLEVYSYATHSWIARAANDTRLEINGACVYTTVHNNDTSVNSVDISTSDDNPGASAEQMICPPLEEGVMKSKDSDTSVNVSFTNDAAEAAQVQWIGNDGKIGFYSAYIQPGDTMDFGTFVTHVWVAVRVSDYSRLAIGSSCSYTVNDVSTEQQNVSITDPVISECPRMSKDIASKQSKVDVQLKVTNAMNETVKLLWINFNGDVAWYWQLNTGEERSIKSYGTHPFIAVTLSEGRVPINNHCYYVTPAKTGEQVLTIGGV